MELGDGDALAVLGLDGGGADNLDRLVARSVTTSHVVICLEENIRTILLAQISGGVRGRKNGIEGRSV